MPAPSTTYLINPLISILLFFAGFPPSSLITKTLPCPMVQMTLVTWVSHLLRLLAIGETHFPCTSPGLSITGFPEAGSQTWVQCPSHTPCPMHLFLCTLFTSFYNQPTNISKLFSWDRWATLVINKTKVGVIAPLASVRSTGNSWDLPLVTEVRGGGSLRDLSPWPVGSDTKPGRTVFELSWSMGHPAGVAENRLRGNTPLFRWSDMSECLPCVSWERKERLRGRKTAGLSICNVQSWEIR